MNDFSIYTARLEEEKKKLEEELASVGRPNPSNPADWEAVPQNTGMEPDSNDQAAMMGQYGDANAILTDLEIRFHEVTDALDRIAKGTYGVCTVGGEAIEPARLEADPAAQTCMEHMNA